MSFYNNEWIYLDFCRGNMKVSSFFLTSPTQKPPQGQLSQQRPILVMELEGMDLKLGVTPLMYLTVRVASG